MTAADGSVITVDELRVMLARLAGETPVAISRCACHLFSLHAANLRGDAAGNVHLVLKSFATYPTDSPHHRVDVHEVPHA